MRATRSIHLAATALVVSAAACGGGSPVATPSPSPTPTATATATDTASPSPSPSVDAATLAFATSVEGEYRGQWRNTTFGSTGNARVALTVDRAEGVLRAEVDVDGGVFGGLDPPLETIEGTLGVLGIEFSVNSPSFGSIVATIDTDGSVTARVEQVPDDRVEVIEASGSLSPDVLNLSYTVTFTDGSTAEGTLVLNAL